MIGQAVARVLRPLVERSPRLAAAYRTYRDAQHLHRMPVPTPLGFSFVGHPGMERGTFEPDEVALLSRLLATSDVFLNVGANMGYYCCLAMSKGVPAIAFEPVPGNLQYLYMNLRANEGRAPCEVHPVAVGESAGLVDIYGGGTAASLVQGWAGISAQYKQTVPLTSLDLSVGARLAGQRCLVLIDVEGAELGVLRGAAQLLNADPKPVWVVEINIDEHQPQGRLLNPNLEANFGIFEAAGYDAWLVGPQLRRVAYDEVRAVARTGRNTFEGHNFLFVAASAGFQG